MQFLDKVQSAILLDRNGIALDSIHKSFIINDLVHNNVQYTTVVNRPGFFALRGNNELLVTVEFIDRPAEPQVFAQALRSGFNRLVLCPDIEDRLRRHRSHLLINVSHGMLSDPVKSLMETVGVAARGASLPQFQKRLANLAFLTALAQNEVPATLVHWTQSNEVFPPAMFRDAAQNPAPGPLHIHPVLFLDTQKRVGIRTFGARHFIGRELLVEPSPVPWQATYLQMLALLATATAPNGYIVPDGDTFGPPDHSVSYRVHHRPAMDGDVPILELEPLVHRASGFQSPAYVPRDRTFDDRNIPADAAPEDRAAQDALRAELRGKRRQAELAGTTFEVRATLPREDAPRPAFGRKKLDPS